MPSKHMTFSCLASLPSCNCDNKTTHDRGPVSGRMHVCHLNLKTSHVNFSLKCPCQNFSSSSETSHLQKDHKDCWKYQLKICKLHKATSFVGYYCTSPTDYACKTQHEFELYPFLP